MRNSSVLLLALLTLSVYAEPEIELEAVNQINVSVIHDDSRLWKKFFNKDKESFNRSIISDFNEMGFEEVAINNCFLNNNKETECDSGFVEPAIMDMRIYVSEIRQGKPKKGLSISLELGNQRQMENQTVEVVPVACRLSDGKSNQLISLSRGEQQIKEKYFASDKAAAYLSKRIFSACKSVLEEQTLIALSGRNGDSKKVYSPLPDVYIEKVTVYEDETQESASAPENAGDTLAKQEPESGVAIEKHQEENKKTKYIIHTQDENTVEIEFGRSRERP